MKLLSKHNGVNEELVKMGILEDDGEIHIPEDLQQRWSGAERGHYDYDSIEEFGSKFDELTPKQCAYIILLHVEAFKEDLEESGVELTGTEEGKFRVCLELYRKYTKSAGWSLCNPEENVKEYLEGTLEDEAKQESEDEDADYRSLSVEEVTELLAKKGFKYKEPSPNEIEDVKENKLKTWIENDLSSIRDDLERGDGKYWFYEGDVDDVFVIYIY